MPTQPKKPIDAPLTTLYRLTVMGGFIACGSMAALRYGPEAGDLAEMIDGAAAMVMEVPQAEQLSEAPLREPAPFSPSPDQNGLAVGEPTSPPAPRFDPAVSTASAVAPIARAVAASPVDPLEQARLTATLLTAGATRADVTPWGAMYRATATVPVGEGTTGLGRQFDGLGGTPEQAVAKVEREIRDAYFR